MPTARPLWDGCVEGAGASSACVCVHRDPFDRLLISQTHAEGLTLVTRDRVIQRYPIATIWD